MGLELSVHLFSQIPGYANPVHLHSGLTATGRTDVDSLQMQHRGHGLMAQGGVKRSGSVWKHFHLN